MRYLLLPVVAGVLLAFGIMWQCAADVLEYVEVISDMIDPPCADCPKRRMTRAIEISGGGRVGREAVAHVLREKVRNAVLGPTPTETRSAWHELLQTLQEAGDVFLSPVHAIGVSQVAEENSREVAEGHRYLTHLLRVGLETFLEGDDAEPRFVKLASPTIKLQGDNPDALYHWVTVPSMPFRLTGDIAGADYFSITVYAGSPGDFSQRVAAEVNHKGLNTSGGTFSVTVGSDAPESGGDHLRLDVAKQQHLSVVTRHYFERVRPAAADESLSPALRIEMLGEANGAEVGVDGRVAERLRLVSRFVRSHSAGKALPDISAAPAWFSLLPNTFGPPTRWAGENEGMGAVDIHYSAGPFQLAEQDDYLLVTGTMPRCDFASVVLWNRFLQTFDYTKHPVSLNRKQLNIDEHGKYRFVIGRGDPGVPGLPWMHSEGRRRGTMFFRFLLAEDPVQTPLCRVVKLSELKGQ